MGCSESKAASAYVPQPGPTAARAQPAAEAQQAPSLNNMQAAAHAAPHIVSAELAQSAPVGACEDRKSRLTFSTNNVDLISEGQVSKYVKDAKPKKSLLKTSGYLGTPLLLMAKQNPHLQDLAFALGACVCQAMSARSLRLDAMRIAKLLEEVENALVRSGPHISGPRHAEQLQDLKTVLDESMAVLLKLKTERFGEVNEEVAAISANGVLGKLRDRIKGIMQALDSADWLSADELSIMTKCSFKQSEQVAAQLSKLGAVEWAYPDTQLLPASNSTKLQLAKVESVVRRLSWEEVSDYVLDVGMVEAIMSDDAELGTGGITYVVDLPQPLSPSSDEACVAGNLMHLQVTQRQALAAGQGMSPSKVSQLFPLAEEEVSRSLFICQNALESPDTWGAVAVDDVLQGLAALLSAPYVAAYIVGVESNHLLGCRVDGGLLGKEPGTVVKQRGRVQARKFSLCQHTIAAQPGAIVRVLPQDIPKCFDMPLLVGAAAGGSGAGLVACDAGVARMAASLGSPGSDPQLEEFLVLVQTGARLMAEGMPIVHAGIALEVEGHAVGTLCILHPPDTWDAAAEAQVREAAREVSARIAQALEVRKQQQGASGSGSNGFTNGFSS